MIQKRCPKSKCKRWSECYAEFKTCPWCGYIGMDRLTKIVIVMTVISLAMLTWWAMP